MTERRVSVVRASLDELQAIIARLDRALPDGEIRKMVSLSPRQIECLRILLEEAAATRRT
jgi:DNA-binding winged helix-turn-helix (wHTH) protein